MKVVCISDTHNLHKQMTHEMPDGDVLVVAGDITNTGGRDDLESFAAWLTRLPYKRKVVVAGNHDWCFKNSKKKRAPNWLQKDESIIYLQDNGCQVDGLNFWGSPWQPEFCNWAFNLPRGPLLKEKWDMIPENTDVLITHGPPKGVLDWCDAYLTHGGEIGDSHMLDRVIDIKPKLHVFGHIHEAAGMQVGYGDNVPGLDNTTFVNAAICDLSYLPVNRPIVVEI